MSYLEAARRKYPDVDFDSFTDVAFYESMAMRAVTFPYRATRHKGFAEDITPTQQAIIRVLGSREMTMNDLCRKLGKGDKTLWNHLDIMHRRGLLEKTKVCGFFVWRVPQECEKDA